MNYKTLGLFAGLVLAASVTACSNRPLSNQAAPNASPAVETNPSGGAMQGDAMQQPGDAMKKTGDAMGNDAMQQPGDAMKKTGDAMSNDAMGNDAMQQPGDAMKKTGDAMQPSPAAP